MEKKVKDATDVLFSAIKIAMQAKKDRGIADVSLGDIAKNVMGAGDESVWNDGKIYFCVAKGVSNYVLNTFLLATEEVKRAMPGCFKF